MRAFNFIKNFFVKSNNSRSEEDRYFGDTSSLFSSSTFGNPRDYLNAYQFIGYVGLAVSIIASDIANLGYRFVNEKDQEIENNELKNIIENPSINNSKSKFLYRAATSLLLDGNIFAMLDKTNAFAMLKNKFNEIVLLTPSLVEVLTKRGSYVKSEYHSNEIIPKGYRVEFEDKIATLLPEEVCHAQMPSPFNRLRGMGKVQINATQLDTLNFINIVNKNFFANGARLDLAIMPDRAIGKEELKMYREKIDQEYGGFKNWKKIMVLPKGSTLEKLNINAKDAELIKQLKFTRQDIFGAMFQIPPIRSGIMEDAKYDSAGDQWKVYYDTTLPSYYKFIEEFFNNVISRYGYKNIRFKFIPKSFVDIEQNSKIASVAFKDGAITGNEYRKMIGIEQDLGNAHLDTYYLPINLIPANQAGLESDNSEKKIDISKSEKAARAQKQGFAFHRFAKRTRDKLEKRVKKDVLKYYEGFEKRAIEGLEKSYVNLDSKALNIDDMFNFTNEFQIAKQESIGFFTSIIVSGIGDYKDFYDLSIDSTFANANIRLVVDMLSTKYADTTLNSRKNELLSLINKALDDGLSVAETKGQLQDYFDTLSDPRKAWRTDRIARAETSNGYNQASKIAYKEMDVKFVQVVGCEEKWPNFDCDTDGTRAVYKVDQIDGLSFHPNHGGTIVPVIEK